MSVLIKGMKMPEKCGSCDLFHVESPMHCTVVKGHKTVGAPYGMPRPYWCPLVEIPEPHGRLIDGDALDTRVRQAGGMGNVEEECTEDFNDGVLFVLDYFVKNAPTVITREDGENHDD